MKRIPIPPYIPQWLRRRSLLLVSVLAAVNRVRLHTTVRRRRTFLIIAAFMLLGGLAVALLISNGAAALAIQSALSYKEIVIVVSGLYVVALVMRLRRNVQEALARSWLIATPHVHARSMAMKALLVAMPIAWRYLVVLVTMLIFCLDSAITLQHGLRLTALVTLGGAVGALIAIVLPIWQRKERSAGSRFTVRPASTSGLAPSSVALSTWPIAQVFAWSRPENSRFLLAAAILTVPGEIGSLDVMLILASWVVISYLAALLLAVPHVARSASEWLRSTPVTFWRFAWPLARRAFLHQFLGALIAMAVAMMLGSTPLSALYLGALWMTIVVATAAISLADCYRSRSPVLSTSLSIVGALVVEVRAQGWGICLALVLSVLYLRVGASYERA